MRPVYVEFNCISSEEPYLIRPISIRLDLIGMYIPCEADKCAVGGNTYINSILGNWLVIETYEEVKVLILEAAERQMKG